VDANSGSALQTAAAHGHTTVVELLLAKGADVNRFTDKVLAGRALQAACDKGWIEVVELLLLHGADPNIGGGPLTCPLIAATRNSEPEILKLLLKSEHLDTNQFGGPDLSSLLINAVTNMPIDSLNSLLEAGADINLADKDGDTPLIVAALCGKEEILDFLLKKGADITQIANRGSALEVVLEQREAAREEKDSVAEERYSRCITLLIRKVSELFREIQAARKASASTGPNIDPTTKSNVEPRGEKPKILEVPQEHLKLPEHPEHLEDTD